MEISTIIGVVFLMVVLFCIFLNSAEDLGDVTYDLSETGTVKVQNDRARIRVSVESDLNESPDQSYKQLMPVVSEIKKMMDQNKNISGLKIDTRTNPEWDMEKGKRKIKGYRARSSISADISIRNKGETLEAGNIQNQISGMGTKGVKVLIDSVNYSVSDSYRAELEGMALRNAIERGKDNARILVLNTYPDRDYRIASVTIRESNKYGPVFAQARSLETVSDQPKDVIAQGDSSVSVTIDMKVRIV